MTEKKSTEKLFEDYVPEIMSYDPEVDNGKLPTAHPHHLSEEERLQDNRARLRAKEQVERAAQAKSMEELLKEYVPEIMYYKPEIDGGEEHMVRDELLSEKERLKERITRLKEKNRGDRKVRR
ncbi:MAG: hypothetical protein MUP09_06945 [Thiovulaceae bacterium]|nr:hypothetical protein [Sulfurimonadaceae bacterium]